MDVTVSTTESDKTVEFILPEVAAAVEMPVKIIKTEQVDCAAVVSVTKDVKRTEVVPEKTFIEIKKEPETVYFVPATSVMSIVTSATTASTPLKATSSNVVLRSVQSNSNVMSVMTSPRNELKTIQAIVKGTGMNPGGQVITKVIIANNPVPGQSRSQQICLTPIHTGAMASSSNTCTTTAAVGQQVKIVTAQQQTILSPTKTISLNQALLASPNKMILLPGTPTKQGVMKLAISPNSKTPTKIMIPVSIAKSPQRIAPAPTSSAAVSFVTNTTSTTNGNKLAVAVSSPQKVILRPTNPVSTILKPGTTLIGQPPVTAVSTTTTMTNATAVKPLVVPISTPANLQSIQVPGSKFQYLRLVTTSVGNSSGTKTATVVPVTTTGKQIVPASLTTTIQPQQSQKPTQVKIAVPIAPVGQPTVVTKQAVQQQRILIPASNVTNVAQIRAGGNITVSQNLASLPPGTALISTSGNLPGLVMVPAQYVTQFQQQFNPQGSGGVQVTTSSAGGTSVPQPILPAQALSQGGFVPIAAAAASTTASASLESSHPSPASRHQLNGYCSDLFTRRSPVESNGIRPRKPCNCTKSQCLKLYCDCFATGEFCNNCNCNNCFNNLEHEEERQKAIKACLDRNPQAFHPKIGKAKDGDHERRHNKGCNCKRSGCLKNYCECYEAKIMCSNMCKCVGCKNFEESAERKTLMHLADAAEVRVQQQTAAKNKFSSQVQDVPSKPLMGSATGERLPFTFITPEVVQATCQCLLAQAEEGEKNGLEEVILEKLVLEEFGRCLLNIIKYANRTKTKNSGADGTSGSTIRSSRTGSNS